MSKQKIKTAPVASTVEADEPIVIRAKPAADPTKAKTGKIAKPVVKKPEPKPKVEEDLLGGGKKGCASKLDGQKLVTAGDATFREGTICSVIQATFKKARLADEGIAEIIAEFKAPRSKQYEENPTAFVKGYLSHMLRTGSLEIA